MVICCTYICQHWVLEGHGVVIDVTTHIGASSPLHSCFWPPWTTGRPGRGSQPLVSPPCRSACPSWCSTFSSSPSHALPQSHPLKWGLPDAQWSPPAPRPKALGRHVSEKRRELDYARIQSMPEYSRLGRVGLCPNMVVLPRRSASQPPSAVQSMTLLGYCECQAQNVGRFCVNQQHHGSGITFSNHIANQYSSNNPLLWCIRIVTIE